ncbi:MAG TPA: ankyrin repeat domain-containing protein [Dongiaceae bacterium]
MANQKTSAVHKAVMRHSLSDLTQAIAQGEKVDALDREGRTSLFYAVADGDTAIVAELIRHGANINAQDKQLETPLHFAAREYRLEATELLLKNGASIDPQDVHGNSPLWRAVFDSKGRGGVIKLLLSAGASKGLRNKRGVSPESLAKSIANYDVSNFLEAKPNKPWRQCDVNTSQVESNLDFRALVPEPAGFGEAIGEVEVPGPARSRHVTRQQPPEPTQAGDVFPDRVQGATPQALPLIPAVDHQAP